MKRYLSSILLLLVSCSKPPLDFNHIQWNEYKDAELKYSIKYPDAYETERDGHNVLFRYGSSVPMVVRFVDEAEGKSRGLWFGHEPAGASSLGGQPAITYIYDHYDGPLGSRTISYVTPFRGKFLGLEFRTDGPLDSAMSRVLDSFTFE